VTGQIDGRALREVTLLKLANSRIETAEFHFQPDSLIVRVWWKTSVSGASGLSVVLGQQPPRTGWSICTEDIRRSHALRC
jgi:hypothetical protein